MAATGLVRVILAAARGEKPQREREEGGGGGYLGNESRGGTELTCGGERRTPRLVALMRLLRGIHTAFSTVSELDGRGWRFQTESRRNERKTSQPKWAAPNNSYFMDGYRDIWIGDTAR